MSTTEPNPAGTETNEPHALRDIGPRPEKGDPGTAEHQAVLAVLREVGAQTSTDDTDTLATRIVNAVRGVTPADDDTDDTDDTDDEGPDTEPMPAPEGSGTEPTTPA